MRFIIRNISLCLLSVCLVGCASVERLAIPKAHLKTSALQNFGDKNDINHKVWNEFLEAYVSKDDLGITRVAYGNVSQADHQNLKSYIQSLAETNIENFSRNAQLAYWGNLYNAQTVNVVLDHYPVDSIRDIKDGFFDLGPWDNKDLTIQGRSMSLHDIEHGIVRALWKDIPEIHYILNCAAAGCPNLLSVALRADNVEKIMQQGAYEYVNSQRGVVVFSDGSIALSKIYSWYIDDFGGSEVEILNHLKKYADEKLKVQLSERPIIRQYFYDWSLNDVNQSNILSSPVFSKTLLNE